MNRRALAGGISALVVIVAVLVGLSHIFGADGAQVPSAPVGGGTSSAQASASPRSVPTITPVAVDLTGLSKTAREFAAVMFSYTPDDSPNAIRARAAKFVADPVTYPWRSPFTVNYLTVEASVQPENITMEPFGDGPLNYVVTMVVDRRESDPSTGQSFARSSGWVVYFTRQNDRWVAEAEGSPPTPTH